VNYFGLPELLFLLVGGIVIIIPLWKVFSKAGYPGSLSQGMILPVVNIALLYFIAFSDWPGTAGVEGVAYTKGPATIHVVGDHWPGRDCICQRWCDSYHGRVFGTRSHHRGFHQTSACAQSPSLHENVWLSDSCRTRILFWLEFKLFFTFF
jgi:hypothetical protein